MAPVRNRSAQSLSKRAVGEFSCPIDRHRSTPTVLHVAIAQALAASNPERRLAWLWNDQGAWICALPAGGAERLNAAAGRVRGGFGGWDWIDQSPPFAAGDI